MTICSVLRCQNVIPRPLSPFRWKKKIILKRRQKHDHRNEVCLLVGHIKLFSSIDYRLLWIIKRSQNGTKISQNAVISPTVVSIKRGLEFFFLEQNVFESCVFYDAGCIWDFCPRSLWWFRLGQLGILGFGLKRKGSKARTPTKRKT